MWPRNTGRSRSPTRSVGAERGFANWPAMRPTLIAGHAGRVGQHHRHLQDHAQQLADLGRGEGVERLGAVTGLEQERAALATRGRAPSSALAPRRRTPAAGTPPACSSAARAPAWSGQSGCCAAGRSRHETGVHVSSTPHRLPANRRSRRSDVCQPGRQGPDSSSASSSPSYPSSRRTSSVCWPRVGGGGARGQVLAVDCDRRAERAHRADRGVRVVDDRPRRVGRHLGHRADRAAGHARRGRTRAIHSATVRVANSACSRGTSSARSATRPAFVA